MGKHIHIIKDKTCLFCKDKTKLRIKDGIFRCINSTNKWTGANYRYRKFKKIKELKCEICNFIPKNVCQIDIHHIDGDHKNNSYNNLQSLCANCHRLLTFLSK